MKRAVAVLAVALLSALLGGLLGEVLLLLIPGKGAWHDILAKGFPVGVPAGTLDLKVLALTFGFSVRLTLMSVLGFVLGGVLYHKLA